MKLIKKIQFWKKLKDENKKLKKENEVLKLQVGDPRCVVEKVLGRGIKWFDAQEMSREAKRKYYAEAQMILNSDVFNNIINFLIATQCQEQVKQYNPELHINPIRDTQMAINAFELLREELESVLNPDIEPKIDTGGFNPYSLT